MTESKKTAPYNRCDYRCGSCIHTRYCKLYQLDQLPTAFPNGTDESPPDMAEVLGDMRESLRNTSLMLQHKARQAGNNPKRKTGLPVTPETPDPDNFPVYSQAHDFTLKLHQFVRHFLDNVPADENIQELWPELDDISWHHTIISVKIARALTSQWEGDEFGREDANNSAEVALKSLRICRMAMGNLVERQPDLFDDLIELILGSIKIEKSLLQQFPEVLTEEEPTAKSEKE